MRSSRRALARICVLFCVHVCPFRHHARQKAQLRPSRCLRARTSLNFVGHWGQAQHDHTHREEKGWFSSDFSYSRSHEREGAEGVRKEGAGRDGERAAGRGWLRAIVGDSRSK